MRRIVGRNPVMEALRSDPRRVQRILIAEGSKRSTIDPILRLAREGKVRYDFVDRRRLEEMAETETHQGVIADVADGPVPTLDELRNRVRAADDALVVVLDHIQDPHNLGAIVRTAEAAGAMAVVIPARRAAAVTQTAVKASAGATEHIPVVTVPNVGRVVQSLQEDGLWVVGATDPEDERSVPYSGYAFSRKTGIVIGAEDSGIGRLVAERCDALVHIPMHGSVSSLNASVAAGIVLFETRRPKSQDAAPNPGAPATP
ncbi:23S rRNA (guanosine(2251)-2'-O)-methyltransferase RlmB [Candidatus Poribacteria bacterium]|nr:23S rRNA (guanosine(2251)-2'-O)-methyltransferase RlmB [Candidatus Poribacteria bacterium]